jgi:hypothetical protein
MLVSESNLNNVLEDVYILETGTYYFFEDFIISEINEGMLFDWQMAQELLHLAENHYGTENKIAYISNRVHSYSLVPQDWLKFFKARNSISAFAVVSYNDKEKSDILIERLFFKSKIKKFFDLNEAVDWAKEQQKEYIIKKTTA